MKVMKPVVLVPANRMGDESAAHYTEERSLSSVVVVMVAVVAVVALLRRLA